MALFTGPLVFGAGATPGPTARPRIVVDDLQVRRAMAKLFPEFKRAFSSELKKTVGPKTVKAIKKETPVQTGDLQASVRQMKVQESKTKVLIPIRIGGIKGKVRGKTVNYAVTIHELGSPRGRGRFFVINPAIATGEAELPQAAKRAMSAAVNAAR